MLIDGEKYDLSYQSYQKNNIEGSINFKCASNKTKVTNFTEKTNKGVTCLELNKEECTELPVHSKASPSCIVVEYHLKSGVVCDNVHMTVNTAASMYSM
jgi:hypothetical protein